MPASEVADRLAAEAQALETATAQRRRAKRAARIIEAIARREGVATLAEIATDLGVAPKSGALARDLRRLHADGVLTRPRHGAYGHSANQPDIRQVRL
jgi:DeoR/GlpR family transcriptional regulator of sugar metabolism